MPAVFLNIRLFEKQFVFLFLKLKNAILISMGTRILEVRGELKDSIYS